MFCPLLTLIVYSEEKTNIMNIEELKTVLDIVNKEIAEEEKKEYIWMGGKKSFFSMDNPEKREWVKRLRKKGVII